MPGLIEVAGLTVSRVLVPHALLGEAHAISQGDRVLTHMTPLDWDRPTQIPAIAAPGALPPGTGGALLNLIAERAVAANVHALRYAGPYPTPALYRALLRSFRTTADEATFTRDLMSRAATLARDEIAVDFTPAPHRRVEHGAHGFSEVRDGLERATIDGITYERDGSPARLVDDNSRIAAEVWFGDGPIARVAVLDPTGALMDGPHPIPPTASSVIGTAFPPPLRAALGELVAELVPAPLATAAHQLLAETTIRWADLGGRAARATDHGFDVHVVLWERIAPLGMARLALALAEALAPVVTTTLVRRALADPSLRPTP